MSMNSPTLGPSHANLQEDVPSTTIPIIASAPSAQDTTTKATAPESQQALQPSHAPTETTAVEERPVTTAEGDATVTSATEALSVTANPAVAPTQPPPPPSVASNPPSATPAATTAAPTDTTALPEATVAAVVYSPLKDMRTASSPIEPTAASLSITLLLTSGVRHQFVMDEAYLTNHSVKTGKETLKDPFEMSVWQLKECIWKDWKEEWDQRPASAMFIRLIHFGRMLEDRHPLKDCRLNQDSPNVVHMTVRPPEVGDDDMTQRSAKGGFGNNRENGNSGGSPSCRCVIL